MRLFVALDLPEQVRAKIADLLAQWNDLVREGARWVRPEGMHITLKFIGHIEDARLAEFRSALAMVHTNAPVEIEVHGTGFFPDAKRPRVLWCGVKADESLKQLAESVDAAVEPLGIERETRDFAPHITLARLNGTARPLAALITAAERASPLEFGSMRETQFHLYESLLQRGGAIYGKVETYSFVRSAP